MTASAQTSAEKWAYGLTLQDDPSPDELVRHSIGLARLADDRRANIGTALFIAAFIGHALARWPEQLEAHVGAYLDQVPRDRPKWRSVLYLALSLCPLEQAAAVLEDIVTLDSSDTKEKAAALKAVNTDLGGFVVTQSFHLDMLWGAFFGSGDARFLRQICIPILSLVDEEAGTKTQAIGRSARWSIHQWIERNHYGVLQAMTTVYAELPALQVVLDYLLQLERGVRADRPPVASFTDELRTPIGATAGEE